MQAFILSTNASLSTHNVKRIIDNVFALPVVSNLTLKMSGGNLRGDPTFGGWLGQSVLDRCRR
jgi:hypothetical protein